MYLTIYNFYFKTKSNKYGFLLKISPSSSILPIIGKIYYFFIKNNYKIKYFIKPKTYISILKYLNLSIIINNKNIKSTQYFYYYPIVQSILNKNTIFYKQINIYHYFVHEYINNYLKNFYFLTYPINIKYLYIFRFINNFYINIKKKTTNQHNNFKKSLYLIDIIFDRNFLINLFSNNLFLFRDLLDADITHYNFSKYINILNYIYIRKYKTNLNSLTKKYSKLIISEIVY